MSLILNIDTATERSSVCLSSNGDPLQLVINEGQKDHAWLHVSIRSILQKNGLRPKDLQAVAVSIGPGSYTGLRVGLSAAKGICYALQLPLITIGTLPMIALAVQQEASDLICPMIDARRMEVFTALYDSSLREKNSPQALVLDDTSFTEILTTNRVLFCGEGSKKFRPFVKSDNASFTETASNAAHLGTLSATHFQQGRFADLAYTEPFYIKAFFSPERK